ncbi:hypothetical protein ACO0RG_000142 [Hanseniaspora osmophila]
MTVPTPTRQHRPSISSSRSSYLSETNDPWDDDHVIVPSSISTFHHNDHHLPQVVINESNHYESSSARPSIAGSSLHSERESFLHERASGSLQNAQFRFFTNQQIENAEGFTSTIENMDFLNDEDAVYEGSQTSLLSGSQLGRRRHGSFYVRPPTTYGSIHSQRSSGSSSSSSSLVYNDQHRGPLDGEGHESDGISHDEDSLLGEAYDNENFDDADLHVANLREIMDLSNYSKLSAKEHEKYFKFNPQLQVQRLYIAEEDLVVGIAGYTTLTYRVWLYYLLCIATFGVSYLFCRWFPKWKLYITSKKTALGKADFVAIETEFGDFELANVKRQWYNRALSTVLNRFNAEEEIDFDPETDFENYENRRGSNNINTTYVSHRRRSSLHDDPELPLLISFEYRFFKLFYSPVEDIFKTNTNWVDKNWKNVNKLKNGLSSNVHQDRLQVFGENKCELEIKSIFELIINEALHPFYIFQVFSIILWAYDEYMSYATCIFIISLFSIASTVYETRKSSQKLAEMSHFEYSVRCYRNGFWISIASSDLVPGDIFELSDPNLSIVPCDCVLLNGVVLVNESMLTGESVPVNKVACDKEVMSQLMFDFQNGRISSPVAKSVMFNGTNLIRTKATDGAPVVSAMCIRTGFSTTKGSLIRSMVFPSHPPVTSSSNGSKASKSKDLQTDAFKYIGYMFIIAMFGFTISAFNFKRLGLPTKLIVVRALDIITIVVPPALPATLTIGINFSLKRLKDKAMFCISPTKINIAGKLDVLCFDKTGTLTEDGLDVHGIQENYVAKGKFSKLMSNCTSIQNKLFKTCLQACHSLNYIDGEGLVGDPLDLKMFEFTHSRFKEHHDSGFTVDNKTHVFKIFEFASHLRRMSCLVREMGSSTEAQTYAVVKGAPEVMIDICRKGTIPHAYDSILKDYTHRGYRVIACAGKKVNLVSGQSFQDLSRDYVENDLDFLGFIIFENKLKTKTKSTLAVLQDAQIRTIMCTGDNILTAVSVSRECGLLPKSHRCFVPIIDENAQSANQMIVWEDVDDPDVHLDEVTLVPSSGIGEYSLAITGDVFKLLFKNQDQKLIDSKNKDAENNLDEDIANFLFSEHYIHTILLKSCIYARMSPDEKHELVEQLKQIDYCVGFCGDGANDCGALKAADIGVSLSEAEASVAAPFTSQNFQIDCVLELIKEGRSSLVTSFACFQYMSLYSAIQFITITILYGQGSNLGDNQFLYIDLFLIVPLAVTMSWSKPPSSNEKIVPKRPSANLVSPKIIVPLILHMLIILLTQIIPWMVSKNMPWYIKPVVGDQDTIDSTDNTVLFFISSFQYVFISIILSLGPPYRQPLMENTWFIMNCVVAIMFNVYLLFIRNPVDSWLAGSVMQLTYTSVPFKIGILVISVASYYLHYEIPNKFNGLFKKKQSSKLYKNLIKRCENISV